MVPSVSVMCTASRMMLTFSARADFEASIEGAESAFQMLAGEAGAGVCPAAGITAKIDTKARRLVLLSMAGPPQAGGKIPLRFASRPVANWVHPVVVPGSNNLCETQRKWAECGSLGGP